MDPFIIQPMFQLLTLLITALSSFFLIRSVIKVNPSDVAKMSRAHFDANPKIGESFAVQKADTVAGFSLLLLSVLLQVHTISQPLRWADTAGLNILQVAVVLIVFFLFFVGSEKARCFLVKKYMKELKDGLGKEHT